MTENEKILIKFYTAFKNYDAKTMRSCYHPNINFYDPAFGTLKGHSVSQMWEMLLKNSKGNMKIEFSDIKADEFQGSIKWIANYNFSKTNRPVTNIIHSKFNFKDGLIIKQVDDFDIWKWSKQAFGITGFLLGWTGYFQKKIREKALLSLKKYQSTMELR